MLHLKLMETIQVNFAHEILNRIALFKLVLSYFRGNYSLTKFAECNHVSTSVAYSTLQRLKSLKGVSDLF